MHRECSRLAAGGNQPRVIRGCRVDAHPRLCVLWPRRGRDRTPLRPQSGARLLDQMGPSCGCLARWTGFRSPPREACAPGRSASRAPSPGNGSSPSILQKQAGEDDRHGQSRALGAQPEAIRAEQRRRVSQGPRDPRLSPACVVHGSSTRGNHDPSVWTAVCLGARVRSRIACFVEKGGDARQISGCSSGWRPCFCADAHRAGQSRPAPSGCAADRIGHTRADPVDPAGSLGLVRLEGYVDRPTTAEHRPRIARASTAGGLVVSG